MLSRFRALAVAAGILLCTLPLSASAQFLPILPSEFGGCTIARGDIHFHCIPIYVGYLVQVVFAFVGTVCIINIIWAGYQIAMSGIPGLGDKEKGKNRLTYALVGLVVCVLAFFIVDMLVSAIVSGV